jgi:hypothetical protein
MGKQEQQLLIIGAVIAAVWLYDQNRLYQDKLATLAASSVPLGHLAGTVDQYVPLVANALDYWVRN